MANELSVIRFCGCTSNSAGSEQGAKFQDRVLGPGRRFYTDGGPTGSTQRCTVCGKATKKS